MSEHDTYPALSGSEKQVAWATGIRSKAIDSITEWLDANSDDTVRVECVTAELNAFIAKFTAARWWIDIRTPADHIIRKGMIEARRRKAEA